jgi:hypothetical protein
MGQKISDGKAFDATAPGSEVINDYDLYRIGGWNGCAIGSKDGTQTDRTMSFECDPAAIYSVKVPGGLTPAVGDMLYWTTNDNTTFQRGDTHLLAAAPAAAGTTAQPCFECISTKNAAGYVQGRVLQSFVAEVT